jgi:hypothetical protein
VLDEFFACGAVGQSPNARSAPGSITLGCWLTNDLDLVRRTGEVPPGSLRFPQCTYRIPGRFSGRQLDKSSVVSASIPTVLGSTLILPVNERSSRMILRAMTRCSFLTVLLRQVDDSSCCPTDAKYNVAELERVRCRTLLANRFRVALSVLRLVLPAGEGGHRNLALEGRRDTSYIALSAI